MNKDCILMSELDGCWLYPWVWAGWRRVEFGRALLDISWVGTGRVRLKYLIEKYFRASLKHTGEDPL